MLSPRAAAFGVEALLKSGSGQKCSNETFNDSNNDELIIKEHTKDISSRQASRQSIYQKETDSTENAYACTSSDLNKLHRPQELCLNHERKRSLNELKINLKRNNEQCETTGVHSSDWLPFSKKLCTSKDIRNSQCQDKELEENKILDSRCSLESKMFHSNNNYKIYPYIESSFLKDVIKKWPSSSEIQRPSSSNTYNTEHSTDKKNENEQHYPQRTLERTILEPFEEQQRSMNKREMNVSLQHRSLWVQFHQHQTEMIVTKNGRRMFPVIKIRVQGLKPDMQYMIYMDIIPVDGRRYRYAYLSSTWVVAGTGDANPRDSTVYIHPDSPASGRRWTDMLNISFDKLKLTNNRSWNTKGQIYLQSMQKYLPRIWIQSLEGNLEFVKNTSQATNLLQNLVDRSRSVCFSFPETTFITVTAYQNQKITRLKINTNPFAKGFRDNSKYKNTAADGQLMTSLHYGLDCQRSQHFQFNGLPSISTPFHTPSLPFNQTLPFPPSCHLRPSIFPNRWSLFPSVSPSNNVISSISSLFNHSTSQWEGNAFLMDLTKKIKKTDD